MKTKPNPERLIEGNPIDSGMFKVDEITVNGAAHLLWNYFDQATDEELEKALARVDRINTTNCWWMEYAVRGAVKAVIECIKEDRLMQDRMPNPQPNVQQTKPAEPLTR